MKQCAHRAEGSGRAARISQRTDTQFYGQGSEQECSFPQPYRTATDNKTLMTPEKSAVTQREQQGPETLQVRLAGPGPELPKHSGAARSWERYPKDYGISLLFSLCFLQMPQVLLQRLHPQLGEQSCVNDQLHPN